METKRQRDRERQREGMEEVEAISRGDQMAVFSLYCFMFVPYFFSRPKSVCVCSVCFRSKNG